MEWVHYEDGLCKNCGITTITQINKEGYCEECFKHYFADCVECGNRFLQERDLQLCDDCVDKFDLNELWRMHDNNKLDALDFNINKNLREGFKLIVR